MKKIFIAGCFVFASMQAAQANETVFKQLIADYQQQGAGKTDLKAAKVLWNKEFSGEAPFLQRSCATCHHSDLSQQGKHVRTKKVIEPMAVSVNPERLSDAKKVEKWFKRNCKWTFGRECTAQEKTDFINYINQ